jgi:hypothetical protein
MSRATAGLTGPPICNLLWSNMIREMTSQTIVAELSDEIIVAAPVSFGESLHSRAPKKPAI